MIHIDYRDGRAIYEQVRDEIKSLIIKGGLKADEQLPSVREIAITLAINPNTIQRAYKELEAEGFIYSVKGKGNFVAPAPKDENGKRVEELVRHLRETVRELYYLGKSNSEIIKLLNIEEETQ